MPSCKCFGICEGDPAWRDPKTGLCCVVCQGSGVYAMPPTFAEICKEIAIRGRQSHSAIVSGDLAYAVREKRRGKRWKARKSRKTKGREYYEEKRAEEKRRDIEAREFRATKMPDPKMLDELKKEWRGNHGDHGNRG